MVPLAVSLHPSAHSLRAYNAPWGALVQPPILSWTRGADMFSRTFHQLAAALATFFFLGSLTGVAHAQFVRHDVRSPEGKKMLKTYANAVAKMKAIKEGDPDSWVFQWYTHSVKGSTTKPQ